MMKKAKNALKLNAVTSEKMVTIKGKSLVYVSFLVFFCEIHK